VQVQFWHRGDPTAYVGYTTNISTTGMFVATNSPMAPGARVRIEVIDRDRGFIVEGIVAHARKIRGDLARINLSGMGIRFLSVEELVRELIPGAYDENEEIPQPTTMAAPIRPVARDSGSSPALASVQPTPSTPARPVSGRVASPPAVPPAAAPGRPATPPPLPLPSPGQLGMSRLRAAQTLGTFVVRFPGVQEFLDVYRRDISQGGLFVSTVNPARMLEIVSVELQVPYQGVDPIVVRARVVHRFEPRVGEGANLLAGMGLELLDLSNVVARMEPIVARLTGVA
jgi:hypothetical protein